MKRILYMFARNTVFANIFLVLIFFAGWMAVTFMLREVFPDVSMDEIEIRVEYPGADPAEVEEGVMRKIEEVLEGMEGVSRYTTTSGENAGTCLIQVKGGYNPADVTDRVRSRVGGISNFPVGSEKPAVVEVTHREAIMNLSLSGDMSEEQLKEWARRVKEEIRNLPEVSQVEIFGTRDYEINIEVSEERLGEYGLTFTDIVSAVSNSNLNLSGGTMRTEQEEIRVRTLGRKYTGEDLSRVIVKTGAPGEAVALGRIAGIRDGFKDESISAHVDGEKAVLLNIFKTRREDALAISEAISAYVREKEGTLPRGARLSILFDKTEELKSRIDLLVKNGIMGLCLVILLLWLFLDFRLSLWAGMGIPVSILGALALFWALGGTINMISLFGLIMVLGIVVDDAIVVGESIFLNRKKGLPPLTAAVEGVSEVGMPVIVSVATTIIAFLPLAFISGVIGKFIAVLPMVVIPCLAISLVECLLLLPAHLNHEPNKAPRKSDPLTRRLKTFHGMAGAALEGFTKKVYTPLLRKSMRHRYVTLSVAICALFITLGLINGGILGFTVLPETDGFIITSTVKFPNGTPLGITREAVERMENSLLEVSKEAKSAGGEPLLRRRLTVAGQTISEDEERGSHLGTVQGILLGSEKRGLTANEILLLWEEKTGVIPGAQTLRFDKVSDGPPGDPVELWLRGPKLKDISEAANDSINRLKQIEGVRRIESDLASQKNELRLELKPEARSLGLTVGDLARQARAGFYGREAVRLQRGEDDIRVKVRYPEAERNRLSYIKQIRIRTNGGHEVPLYSVAKVSFSPGFSTIKRVDGMRCVKINADVDLNKANPDDIIEELSGFLTDLKARYPGLDPTFEGEEQHMEDSVKGLLIGFPLAIIGIFIIIATMFRSYAQPLVILATVPFGIIGAVWGHLILGYDLSLISVFGMVALSGVVINDTIVLIERINENLARGMRFQRAVEKGGVRRFRAIALTTLSTVGGLSPLILEGNTQAQFLIPMAVSVAGGLVFATGITLLVVPGIMVILNDLRLLWARVKTGQWLPREEVEPGACRYDESRENNSAVLKKKKPEDISLSVEELYYY